MPGKVYLVGAGPGDPGLLTVRGRECLGRATCVVYDYLANPRLLDLAPPDAERLLVGKHGGGARVSQYVINDLLVDRARQGHTVVRLKGGDPFVFGRGGEEAQALRAAGLAFEVVPGVSSAVAVPAYAGIPLTHRDFASAVTITTGYEDPDKDEPAVRWDEIARPDHTIVLLMTTRQLERNARHLLDGGLAPETPAALIEWGTRADQRTAVGTLATLAATAAAEDIGPPALAVIGNVVRLRDELAWQEQRPLFGRRIIVTRPRHQAPALAAALEEHGAEVVVFPTIEIAPPDSLAPLDDALDRAAAFDWVIFTSANGVQVFFDRLRDRGHDIRDWHRARIAAIGPQTARALEGYAVRVAVIPEDFRAEGLLATLGGESLAGCRVLLPRAGGARAILPDTLRARGAIVEEVVTYVSRLPAADVDTLRAWIAQGVDLVTFTSSSTAEHFARIAWAHLGEIAAHTRFGCIGPVTADTARRHGMDVAVEPASYTIPAFAAAIVDFFRTQPLRRGSGRRPHRQS